jgi:Xaa-Pro aminopeptidase
MRDAFEYLRRNPGATEGGAKNFVLEEFRKRGLVMDKPFDTPIVAFNEHAAEPHYRPVPGRRRLKPGTLVLIDIWGRLRGKRRPYADITWMGYCGTGRGDGAQTPQEVRRVFSAVIGARDACLAFIRKEARRGRLPAGRAADEAAYAVVARAGYKKYIKHRTGHALGFVSPHGRGRHLNLKNRLPLLKNLGYTIEPGIYMNGRLGVRSEINFYIDGRGRVIVTTPPQRRLVRIV